MEATPSVTLTLPQVELLKALRVGNAAAIFEAARGTNELLDIGGVDGDEATRTIVGPEELLRQIFPEMSLSAGS